MMGAAPSFAGLLAAALALRWAFARVGLVSWRPDREAVGDALGAGLIMGAVATDYTWVKLLISAINGQLWDLQLGALDRTLCLGVDPNRFALAVLEAMTRPDPRPPADFDNPVEAIERSLPEIPLEELVHIVRTLNALGLTRVPYIMGLVSARVAANPREWITVESWAVLRAASEQACARG